jgi:glutathionyl-hydroquinone reductase
MAKAEVRGVYFAAQMMHWLANSAKIYHSDGHFTRPDSVFRHFVSKDPNSKYPAEKGRYVLYVSPGCPWVGRRSGGTMQ